MEEWRDIDGYEGLYQVSSEGRVRSLDRYVEKTLKNGNKYMSYLKGEIKSKIGHKNGYEPYALHKDGKLKAFLIHQLVAKAFIPNPNGYTVVHHKDHNVHNNNVDNLMWVDKTEHNVKHHMKQVYQCTIDGEIIATYPSIKEAAKQTGFDGSCISRCSNPKCKSFKSYKGFKWIKS